jgi:hypothetical protein
VALAHTEQDGLSASAVAWMQVRVVTMTREEYDQAMAELDLPYERRQRLKEQREQEKLRGRERNLTDAEMAR